MRLSKLAHETCRLLVGAEHSFPFVGNDLDGHHGLGRSVMHRIGLEAEHLARHMEGADLPASVGQELGDADHARDDLVDITRSLALGVNLGIAGKAHGKTDLARGLGRSWACACAETAKGRCRSVSARRARQHLEFLPRTGPA